jgi:outer membrane scaffolding protein for murein synthesis (MipA/OmpV family)
MYTRLKGSAARTPMTALRGSRNQWVAAAGLGFTF